MLLRLLGPVEIVTDGVSLGLGGPRQRTVLAALGLNVNRVTSVDQLIDAVWDDNPPSTARSQIQVSISALRRVLAAAGRPNAILTRVPGYQLELDDDDLDTLRFSRLVGEAHAQAEVGAVSEAVASLESALDCWQGSALSGVTSDAVRRGAIQLADRHLTVVEERIRLCLLLGRHDHIMAEMWELVAQHPLRERLHGFLMIGLYRSGRQAEALEVLRRARSTLIDQIGIEPGHELQALGRQILVRDPELLVAPDRIPAPAVDFTADGPTEDFAGALPGSSAFGAPPQRIIAALDGSAVPRQLPASVADFAGRVGELARIRELFTEIHGPSTHGYAVPVVAICGAGGAGKSSLAVRAAHELGCNYPDGHLYANLHAPAVEDPVAVQLGRFLRALGVPGKSVPDDPEERAELYRTRLADRRVLVVLDGAAAAEHVQALLPGSPSCAVIVTTRTRLAGLHGAYWIDLARMEFDDSVALLAGTIGRTRVEREPAATEQLATFCDGLPLALRIAGARLAARPTWPIQGLVDRLHDEARRLDEFSHQGLELRSAIELTYRALAPPARELFRILALVDLPDFPAWIGAALLDRSIGQVEKGLDLLVEAHMLEAVDYLDARLVRYRLHDLVRVYARERLLVEVSEAQRRSALERVVSGWLSLAEAAHRAEYGGDYTVLHGCAPRWPAVDAVHLPSMATWWDGERSSLVATVRQAAAADMTELSWDLALAAVTLFEGKGYFDDWRETSHVAREAAQRGGDEVGVAAMEYSLGTLAMYQSRLDDAGTHFTAALDGFRDAGHDHGRALVLRNAAHVHALRGDTTTMMASYAEALPMMRRAGDRVGEAHILRSQARYWLDRDDHERAEVLLTSALQICQEVGCLRVEAQVIQRFAELHLATDRIDDAQAALRRVLRIVRHIGDRIGESHALYGMALARRQQDRDDAVTILGHALDLSRAVGENLIEARSLALLGEIASESGDFGAAAARLAAAAHLFDELGMGASHDRTQTFLRDVVAGRRPASPPARPAGRVTAVDPRPESGTEIAAAGG